MKSTVRFLLVAACATGLGACDHPNVTSAKDAVRRVLVDPESAQFRDVRQYSKPDSPVLVCGKVNAKNRMGGYTGFHNFMLYGATVALGADELQSATIGACCSLRRNAYILPAADAPTPERVSESCNKVLATPSLL